MSTAFANWFEIQAPTVDPALKGQPRRAVAGHPRSSIIWPSLEAIGGETAAGMLVDPGSTEVADNMVADRETTLHEFLIGELRRWRLLGANWDGEGAAAPDIISLKSAENFARLIPEANLPEPMLYASGRAGFYWNSGTLYADIEFLEGNRISYYIERAGGKHKGVVNYSAHQMPPVLAALLQS